MQLSLLISGAFFILVTSGQEQKTNCNVDPDLIKFEDKDLEAVLKSLYSSGNCSGAVWKKEVLDVFKKHKKEILDMSVRDKSMLRYLISFVIKPEAERPPPDYFLYLGTLSESELMNPLDFGPSSESPEEPQEDTISPIYWKFGSDRESASSTSATRTKRQLPEYLRPSLTENPRGRWPKTFPSGDEFERPPRLVKNIPSRFIGEKNLKTDNPGSKNLFEFGNEMQQNQWEPFSYNSQEDPFSQNIPPAHRWNRPLTQQNAESEDFWINSQRDPIEYSSRDKYKNSFHQPLPLGRPSNSFSRPPNKASGSFFAPDNQRRPVDHNSRNQKDSYNRPRPQGHPGDSFSRPPNKASSNSFTPNNERRPAFNTNIFSKPQRPQLGDIDIIMPDDLRLPGNVDDDNNVFGNANQVTTERPPKTTTRPGPPSWATPPSLCVKNCPNTPEFNPVCGSDRITYSNPGHLRCEQQCGKASVVLNYYGSCVTTTTDFSTSTTQTTAPSLSRRSRNRAI